MRLGRGFPLPFAYHHLIAWISAAILAIKAATNFAISYGVGFFCLPLILCRTSFPVVIILYHQNGDMSILFSKKYLLFQEKNSNTLNNTISEYFRVCLGTFHFLKLCKFSK